MATLTIVREAVFVTLTLRLFPERPLARFKPAVDSPRASRGGPGITCRMEAPTHADPLIAQLLSLLQGGNAHATLEAAVENFPDDQRGTAPRGLPYSAWQLIEHLRITQRDILDFCAPPPGGYKHLAWPADYWPKAPTPPAPAAWNKTLAAIAADAQAFEALLTKPKADLYAPFAWGEGQNLLREALLLADHNSYHTGELIVLRRLLAAGCTNLITLKSSPV